MGCSLVSVAFTGVAACNIPGGRTIHSVFGIPMHASGSTKLPLLGSEQACVLKAYMENASFLRKRSESECKRSESESGSESESASESESESESENANAS